MSTQAQIAANQMNAQHSTGPRSEEGKAAASRNNLKVGLTGHFIVMPWEEQEEFDMLFRKLLAEHQPSTGFETDLVQKMAQHYWLSLRALVLQEGCFDLDHVTLAEEQEKQLALYMRYQTTHERAFERCGNELRKLRNESRKTKIGFESQKRKEADEARKQANENRKKELHQLAVLLAEAKLTHQQVPIDKPESPQRVPATAKKSPLQAETAA